MRCYDETSWNYVSLDNPVQKRYSPSYTRFETVSGYVSLITVHNLSRTLLNIYVPSHCRRLNTLDHRAWWSLEAAHYLND